MNLELEFERQLSRNERCAHDNQQILDDQAQVAELRAWRERNDAGDGCASLIALLVVVCVTLGVML